MALILKNGAVFLHIPKTGGTWVTKVLREQGLVACSMGHRHANWQHLLAPGDQGFGRGLEYAYKRARFLRPRPRPFLFCFVRNPLDWYESFFAYKAQPSLNWERDGEEGSSDRWHPNAILNGLGEGFSFNEFVENVVKAYPGYVTALFSHYTFVRPSFVGRQESLARDLVTVLEEMNLAFDRESILAAERVNASRPREERLTWDPELRKRVLLLENASLERFGYAAE